MYKYKKTHNCGELNKSHVGEQVTLTGWVQRQRDLGGVVFITLRDRSGIVQITVNGEKLRQRLWLRRKKCAPSLFWRLKASLPRVLRI